jgi:hypothetical protein
MMLNWIDFFVGKRGKHGPCHGILILKRRIGGGFRHTSELENIKKNPAPNGSGSSHWANRVNAATMLAL